MWQNKTPRLGLKTPKRTKKMWWLSAAKVLLPGQQAKVYFLKWLQQCPLDSLWIDTEPTLQRNSLLPDLPHHQMK